MKGFQKVPCNTLLTLMYRDASNYKTHQTIVLSGLISDAQIEQLQSRLEDGCFIIADQVGLPSPAEQFIGFDGFPCDDDHAFTTLSQFQDATPRAEHLHTNAPVSRGYENCSITQVVERILATEWDSNAEMARLEGFPGQPKRAA